MADLGQIYSYSYHTNIKTKPVAGSSMATGVASTVDPTKAAWLAIPEDALLKKSNKFSIGPSNNEFVYEYTYGSMTKDFHWQEYPSVDNVIVRQAWMVAFYLGVGSATPLAPTPRGIKDQLLKGGDMRSLVK
jgi:hypothetical protein